MSFSLNSDERETFSKYVDSLAHMLYKDDIENLVKSDKRKIDNLIKRVDVYKREIEVLTEKISGARAYLFNSLNPR